MTIFPLCRYRFAGLLFRRSQQPRLIAAATAAILALTACTGLSSQQMQQLPPTPAPAEAATTEAADTAAEPVTIRTFFAQPSNNAIVPPKFKVAMATEGLAVEPAGEVRENAGHMHILVDTDFIPAGQVLPKDEQHLHFGDGALETELELAPGAHTLRLQFADGAHTALEGDQFRDEIVISVAEGAPEQGVRFVTPTDAAAVPPTFKVVMAAAGLAVEPAGEIRENAGHMHILVDADFIPAGQVVPKDEQHLHFGTGALETELELGPGEHVLRLQFADGTHTTLEGEQYRDELTVTVTEDAPAEQVMFVEPQAGTTVPATFPVKMAASGLIIEQAGPVLRETGGHLHILVNEDFVEPGQAIPSDETHLHFGKGQLEAELSLEPGEHTLRLQMANGAHVALEGEQYRHEINITVAEE
jgi:hypothetical protein